MDLRRLPYLPRLTDRLAVRLVLLLTIALLPLGLVAVLTTAQTVVDARRSAERAMVGMTVEAVAGKRALVESAFASANTLGPVVLERLDSMDECSTVLSEFMRRSGVFSFVGLIEMDGQVRCRSGGDPTNLAGTEAFERLLERPAASVTARRQGMLSNEPELIVMQPIREGIELRGFMMIALPQRRVELMRRPSEEAGPASTILFNHHGELLTNGNADDPEVMLPTDRSLAQIAQRNEERIFYGQTEAGDTATFAVAELIPRRLYALGTWPEATRIPAGVSAVISPLVLPVLMWIASLGVAYFAVYRLVLRHVRTLNQQMRRFALGHRDTPPKILSDAPSELREVSATFQKLARILARDEAELEASLAEKTVLLKEIHHRVKNNLQLIASILNLQMRQVRDPSARAVLQSVQDRVIGLATIHRSLYQSERLSEVRADKLIDEISRQLLALGAAPGSGIAVRTRFDSVLMSTDRLVPLSLLLTEAVTNALKYVGRPPNGGAPWLEIALCLEGDEIELLIRNSLSAQDEPTEPDTQDFDSTRLGADLIEVFAMQLEGTLEQGKIKTDDGPVWQLSLRFARETIADSATGLAEAQEQPAAAE
ncbi:MAG: sensor histidine kinase [Pararhodobacter sp.]|nr:sensor histidine kinase [Pararhodobacter sp.]